MNVYLICIILGQIDVLALRLEPFSLFPPDIQLENPSYTVRIYSRRSGIRQPNKNINDPTVQFDGKLISHDN